MLLFALLCARPKVVSPMTELTDALVDLSTEVVDRFTQGFAEEVAMLVVKDAAVTEPA